MIHTPGGNEDLTAKFCVSTEGKKHLAVTVFNVAAKTRLLSRKRMDMPALPGIIVIMSTKSAWWNEFLDHESI